MKILLTPRARPDAITAFALLLLLPIARVPAQDFTYTNTTISIPGSVVRVGSQAFGDCRSLVGVYFQANAPSLGSDVFTNANNTTVYYTPGTTGWTSTFGGRPAVLWNPLIQTNDASFGVRQNRFGFNLTFLSLSRRPPTWSLSLGFPYKAAR
jgi:hypothetical protein